MEIQFTAKTQRTQRNLPVFAKELLCALCGENVVSEPTAE
jgi:hypothetical protein